jgi:predicted nucleic acid-binding protein
LKRGVDTSAWIEWFEDSPIAGSLGPYLAARQECIVPTIVQLELAKWLYREIARDAANRALAYVGECPVVVLDTTIAFRAAAYCRAHKLATADAIVYATAREAGADLLTCDAHFEGLDGVVYVPKSTA